MTLAVRKIYIDSRFLTSGNSSSFQYELPDVLELPKDTVAFITEVTTVASWDTVSATRNNQLYVIENTGAAYSARIVTLPSGAYDSETLRVIVENGLNGAGKTITGNYNVQRSSSAGTVNTASLGAAFRYFTITISGGGSCSFVTDPWLKKRVPTCKRAVHVPNRGVQFEPYKFVHRSPEYTYALHSQSFVWELLLHRASGCQDRDREDSM